MRFVTSVCITAILAAAGLACGAPLPEAKPEDAGVSAQRLERLTAGMQRIVDSGELAGMVVLVARRGKLVYQKSFGLQDKARNVPMSMDSIFRVYSMTKPVVSVAAMILVEEGRLSLDEPISKYLPEFKDMKVGVESFDPATGAQLFYTLPAKRQITVQDLLRHTSGFTYGTTPKTQVQKLYGQAGLFSQKWTLDSFCKELAKLPLQYEPGTVWEYGHSSDVLGRVVEVASGQALDRFLAERIFKPLKMVDTAFDVPPAKQGRLAQPQLDPQTGKVAELIDVTQPATFFAGGHGLTSTAGDYLRFAQMLANGGELDGVRILGPRTIAFMASDHVLGSGIERGSNWIPGNGYGFGLGFAVRRETGQSTWPGSVGEFFWAGYAGTYFWIDPKEQLVPVYMSQEPNRRQHYRVIFRDLVYQSLTD
ncbi:MAG TPA: serine hydrolase domain-containing protein [Burkholderiales bacterium]|nr:serine hydrolase domain-containing protein [Burkholderiales bacterium]